MDILPQHLQVYQRDHAGTQTMTHRHTTLYVHAMELVRLGDACVVAYEKGMDILRGDIATLAEFVDQRDGLALEDRASGGAGAAATANENRVDRGDVNPATQDGTIVGLGALEKKHKGGGRQTAVRKHHMRS